MDTTQRPVSEACSRDSHGRDIEVKMPHDKLDLTSCSGSLFGPRPEGFSHG